LVAGRADCAFSKSCSVDFTVVADSISSLSSWNPIPKTHKDSSVSNGTFDNVDDGKITSSSRTDVLPTESEDWQQQTLELYSDPFDL
jgi:hypothetical protein